MNWGSLFSFKRKVADKASNKISVLIELSSFDKGGLEKVVLDSAILFDRTEFEVTIVTPGNVGYLGEEARRAGIKVIGLPDAKQERVYERLLIDLSVDVTMSHFSDTGYGLFAKRNIPNITFIHNVYGFFSEAQERTFKQNDQYVSRYISVSRNATRFAVNNLGIDAAKVVTIPNGLIIHEHEARAAKTGKLTRADFGLSDTDYVFANVASYNLHKGHYVMADAMKKLLKKRNDVKILCVGNTVYPPHFTELTDYLDREGLKQYILMPGYFPNVEDIHNISDAFLLPSFIEGWSIAMNEAMFYQKPMILSDTGAASEVIRDNDLGILIPNEYGDTTNLTSELLDRLAYTPQNYRVASQLAEAMDEMATNRLDWKDKARLGRARIYAEYDFANIVKQYETLMRALVCKDS